MNSRGKIALRARKFCPWEISPYRYFHNFFAQNDYPSTVGSWLVLGKDIKMAKKAEKTFAYYCDLLEKRAEKVESFTIPTVLIDGKKVKTPAVYAVAFDRVLHMSAASESAHKSILNNTFPAETPAELVLSALSAKAEKNQIKPESQITLETEKFSHSVSVDIMEMLANTQLVLSEIMDDSKAWIKKSGKTTEDPSVENELLDW